jgi:hypothetical protein
MGARLASGRRNGESFRAERRDERSFDRGAPLSAHDYTREPGDAAQIDVARVDRMLLERIGAKRARDFAAADALRESLQAMGVHVNDKEKLWAVSRGAGVRGAQAGARRGEGGGRRAERSSQRVSLVADPKTGEVRNPSAADEMYFSTQGFLRAGLPPPPPPALGRRNEMTSRAPAVRYSAGGGRDGPFSGRGEGGRRTERPFELGAPISGRGGGEGSRRDERRFERFNPFDESSFEREVAPPSTVEKVASRRGTGGNYGGNYDGNYGGNYGGRGDGGGRGTGRGRGAAAGKSRENPWLARREQPTTRGRYGERRPDR